MPKGDTPGYDVTDPCGVRDMYVIDVFFRCFIGAMIGFMVLYSFMYGGPWKGGRI